MSLTERVYQSLLRLFPVKHRMEFGEDMLQHVRDLNRDAARQGIWNAAGLCISLVKDGILNAWIEHREGIMTANREIIPASWFIVLLAALPGMLILLTRRINPQLAALDPIAWYVYLGLLVTGGTANMVRKKRFPVWALLPLGALVAISAVVLPGQRLPRAAWVLGGVMIVGNLVLAILYSF
jgi:hypothetical protein